VLDALEIRTCRLEARLGATLQESRLKVWVAAGQVLDETVGSQELAATRMEQALLQLESSPPRLEQPWWRRYCWPWQQS
jgi:hypothetical protein